MMPLATMASWPPSDEVDQPPIWGLLFVPTQMLKHGKHDAATFA